MRADLRKNLQIRVKKLALSYKTGWEYLPESEEAGSVLTDIFLDMELENRKRFERIWEKQEQAFLNIVPRREEEPRRLETALSVKTTDEGDGQWLAADTRVYTVTEQGSLLSFRTVAPLRLAAARLRWVIRRRGLWAWLCYREGDAFPISLSASADRALVRPVFRWRFRRLCDGHHSFSFSVEFREVVDLSAGLPGSWTISDGREIYPAAWQQSAAGVLLKGESPGFAKNLEEKVYELRLELSDEETLLPGWLKALTGGFSLKEEAATLEPELCLTDIGQGGIDRVLPFGSEPAAASCFYLACDRAAAGASGELTLQFTEEYETEERSPEPEAKEYGKLYRKYPWLQRTEPVQDWRAEETLWEYFNGRLWCALPGSGDWNTGCRPEEPGERLHRFFIPQDISPCSMEGEEHIYLRLRIDRARGAYASYYRKRIPVLKTIRFHVGERCFEPESWDVPDVREAAEEKVYFGFDRDVVPDNCWFTGKGCRRFEPEQIKGQGERFGRKACWVEVSEEGEELAAFLPNYVVVRQEAGENEGTEPREIPEKTVFYVETGKTGVVDAVSVSDARYDKAGAPVREEKAAAENYFSHFGRLLTVMDMELLMQERYPFFRVEACSFHPERGELEVKLEALPQAEGEEAAEGRLPEVSEWLCGAVRQMGALWLQEAKVNCILCEESLCDLSASRSAQMGIQIWNAESVKLDDSSYDVIWEKAVSKLESRADWWSHREISDPGITLMEMWAVLCDMQSFYLDQMQESHYRGYLKLLGIEPDEGSCARVWVLFRKVKSDCTLPAGTRVLADTMVFETAEEAELTANRICGFFRGADGYCASGMLLSRKNRLALKKAEVLFSFLLEKPLRVGHSFLFFVLLDERRQRNPPVPGFSLVRLAWEYRTEEGWREARTLQDGTLGLLYSGCVCLGIDFPMTAREGGGYEIRCRVAEGEYDEMPTLYKVSLNAVEAVQKSTRCCQEYGVFSRSCVKAELQSYLAKTGKIQVFAEQGEGLWRDITAECGIEPPITAERQKRYVYFRGEARVKFVCSADDFEEEYGPCPVTGITAQRISLPWENVLRDSVELMLAQGEEGLYREYRRTDPEEVRFGNAWYWGEEDNAIVLGDGRHGDIPPASGKGLLLTNLALFEGEKGNVSIGRIGSLENPDLFHGISCSNPMTGKGGRARMSPSGQFREAGAALRQLNRIVTKEDAEELARRIPGLLVQDAGAEWKEKTMVVTILPKVSLGNGYCRRQYRSMAEKYLEQYRPAGVGIRVEIAGEEQNGGAMSFGEISV